MDPFWKRIDEMLDRLEVTKPTTFDEVKTILDSGPGPINDKPPSDRDAAFFAGGGGDRQLYSSLRLTGWKPVWVEAVYYYCVRHLQTEEVLTYIEGDVLRGDRGTQ